MRLNTQVDIIYTRHESIEKEKLSLTKNISIGGICLICYEQVKESDLLDLRILLPGDKQEINAIGKVVWVKEFIIGDMNKDKRFDAGIEFINIQKNDIQRIEQFIFSVIK